MSKWWAGQSLKKISRGLAMLLVLGAAEAHAVSQEVRALFQPDPSKPNKNEFVNQTPNTGYCAIYPAECANHGVFSIEVPVRFNSTRYVGIFDLTKVKAPGNWRRLTVVNSETQETQPLEVRIAGVGSTYVLSDAAKQIAGGRNALEGHSRLWTTGNWEQGIPAPCQYSGVGEYSENAWRFFWKMPVEAHCFKIPAYHIRWMHFERLDFSYELRTPDPLKMSTGRYTGSMTYSLGPDRDFDFGKLFEPDDDSLTLDFVLDVQHTLKVDIPPGGNHIVLQPEGGWQRWLDSGRKPARIYRDQLFHISASSKFSMRLECEYDLGYGSDCAIVERGSGYAGAVKVSVSLPNGLTDNGGQSVVRRPIGLDGRVIFKPSTYVEQKPGTLHFEISASTIDHLIKNANDKPYKGNITVIWDSEVG